MTVRKRFRCTGLLLLLATAACRAQTPTRVEPTTFIRELAKCDVRVNLIVSGPHAAGVAKSIQDQITTHKDALPAQRDAARVPILSLADAESAAADPAFDQSTRIFLLCRDEMAAPLADSLARANPMPADQLKGLDGAIYIHNMIPRAGKLSFSIALCAPDAIRLKLLERTFTEKNYPNYRNMLPDASETFTSRRLALYGGGYYRSIFATWGRVQDPHIWFAGVPHPNGEPLTPLETRESQCVYFIDRSHVPAALPPSIAALIDSQKSRPTGLFVNKIQDDRGKVAAVFSAPNALSLARKALSVRSIDAIPEAGLVSDLIDLRPVSSTPLLVQALQGELSEILVEKLRLNYTESMLKLLGAPMRDPGAAGEQVQRQIAFLEPNSALEAARSRLGGARYVWLLRVGGIMTQVKYEASERRLADAPPSYQQVHPDDPEPPKPSLGLFSGRGEQAKYKDELAKWQPVHDKWQSRFDTYKTFADVSAPCPYERTLTRTYSAKTAVTLSLYDLRYPDKPIWQRESPGEKLLADTAASDRITIRGFKTKPRSIPPPATPEPCPESVRRDAVEGAGVKLIGLLADTAWFADDPKIEMKSDAGSGAQPPKSSPGIPGYAGTVADVDGEDVIIKVDASEGVRIGDTAIVAVRVKDVADPDDPSKILVRTPLEFVRLKVASVTGNAAFARAVTGESRAAFASIRTGMSVKFEK